MIYTADEKERLAAAASRHGQDPWVIEVSDDLVSWSSTERGIGYDRQRPEGEVKETGIPAISVLFLPDKGEEKDRFAIVLSNWPASEDTAGVAGSLGAVSVLIFPHEVEVR